MPNGKPGDHPYTDLILYRHERFGPEIDDKILKIHSLAISTVQRHLSALVSGWPTDKGRPLNPKDLSETLDTLMRVVEVMRTDT